MSNALGALQAQQDALVRDERAPCLVSGAFSLQWRAAANWRIGRALPARNSANPLCTGTSEDLRCRTCLLTEALASGRHDCHVTLANCTAHCHWRVPMHLCIKLQP